MSLLAVSVFASDNPIVNFENCSHGDSLIEQCAHLIFGD